MCLGFAFPNILGVHTRYLFICMCDVHLGNPKEMLPYFYNRKYWCELQTTSLKCTLKWDRIIIGGIKGRTIIYQLVMMTNLKTCTMGKRWISFTKEVVTNIWTGLRHLLNLQATMLVLKIVSGVCVWMKLGELRYHLSGNGYTLTRIGCITENRPLQCQHLPIIGHLGINLLYLAVLMMTK